MLEHLTKDTFLTRIFNFESGNDWSYRGEKPCVIDFYADWCGPCRIVSPILEELAEVFKDKLNIYKVNTEEETELASVFGIRNIPSILFVPLDGNPRIAVGALPKEIFLQAFREILGVEK